MLYWAGGLGSVRGSERFCGMQLRADYTGLRYLGGLKV